MNPFLNVYEFAASAGALEGYVYSRKNPDMDALTAWVNNLVSAYDHLPPDAVGEFQSSLDATLGRAVRSLEPVLEKDHHLLTMLRSMVKGGLPASADDFQKEKWFDR